ncbi:transcription factor GLABRA 3-like [Diospyros lotus]|uniref:transcription factor GLABRA 3-like n=1 Tax=Diospyros lotus TaxID=55363 RepID=UPI00224FA355|nr:transcription factor GLABRA 3-like [Diospyros lotus]
MDYRVPENLRRHLAYAVRSIQWSYAIFWAISSRHQGMLKWGEGYYNGDIKTRKTVQAMEVNEDQLGLERSEQLRELYESLSAGESSSSPQSRRPSAALSPEDLTNTEWFYLVCMSFFFNIGQGLPGRTLANGQPIWLCNAHYADSRVFSRSLLAKSASVQTVACFPFSGGVIEIGVTELVPEDLGLIQHIRTSFLGIPCPVPQISTYSKPNQEILHTNFDAIVECEDVKVCSPHSSSNRLGLTQQAEELLMADDLNEGASQVQSWQLMDDEVSYCDHNSMSSIDCISQTWVNCEKVREKENENDGFLLDIQEDNQMKLTSMDLQADDIHYHTVVSTLLKSSHQLILGPNFRKLHHKSSFVRWKKGGFEGTQLPQSGAASQRLLKKVLFEVARMPGGCWVESREDYGGSDGLWRPQVDSVESTHALAERRRRGKLNEKFVVLGSLVPSTSKADKASILDNAIEYVKELKRKVEELNSFREPANQEARTKRKPQDITERTSDNYGDNSKRFLTNKHKATNCIVVEDEDNSTDNVTVSMAEKGVLIEIRCPWREWLLLEIMNAISRLHLDPSSVQSTNIDGILSLTIKSKFKGSAVGSLRIIRQALQRAVDKC